MYSSFGTEIDQFGIDYEVEHSRNTVTYYMGGMAYPGDFEELMDIAEGYVDQGMYVEVSGGLTGKGDYIIRFHR